jgi:hypothetical protein
MMTTEQFFDGVAKGLKGGSPLKAVGGVISFEIDTSTYVVDLDKGTVGAKGPQPQVIVRATGRDFMAVVEGRMSVNDGLITDRLHVAGEAARLAKLFEAIDTLRNARGGGAGKEVSWL